MKVSDLIASMESIAPPEAAEAWDRVGLHIGERGRELSGPVMLTIDLTERVLGEAVAKGCSAVIAYHPPIWDALDRITGETARERIVLGAIRAGLAVYSPHTALDATPGGVTEWLCEGLSGASGEPGRIAGDCRALIPFEQASADREVKLVVFVPEGSVDQIRSALATAGAGGIGKYRVCSFAMAGLGTFLPEEGAHPTIGEVGTLEKVKEWRLEMVCARRALPLAIETLREFHPYEEPAFDVVELEPTPRRRVGVGRRLVLDQPATVGELAERLKAHLDRSRVRVALPWEDERKVKTIGIVPGAGEELLGFAAAEGCELFITGEMKHHSVLRALHKGVGVLLAGHTNTEHGYLARLSERLGGLMPGVEFVLAETDTDILKRM